MAEVRKFETGATRDADTTKPDFEGFLSPLVVARFGEYMHDNRVQRDGSVRDSDNWQKGIPQDAYMKSGWRHFFAWWGMHRGLGGGSQMLEHALCGLLFNAMGYLHEHLKRRGYDPKLEWDKLFLEKEKQEASATTVQNTAMCPECKVINGHYTGCTFRDVTMWPPIRKEYK